MDHTKTNKASILKPILFGLVIVLALLIRFKVFNLTTADYDAYLAPWYTFIVKHGLFHAFSYNFYNYTPPYLYLIGITTLFPWIPSLWAIKLISVVFDLITAIAVYKIVRLKYKEGDIPWIGLLFTLFAPTVLIESGLWGQCDIIYTSFLIWSLYYILKEKFFLSVVFFSIAFAFKVQAIFFAPLILLLVLNKKIKLYWLLAPIGIYILAVTPAWIMGRSLISLLTIYINQYDTYKLLSLAAPNPYIFLGQNPLIQAQFDLVVRAGMIIAFVVILVLVFYRWKNYKRVVNIGIESYVFEATIFTLIAPYLLPQMHERYFFAAGVFIIILMAYEIKYIIPAMLLQFSSILSYLPFLYNAPVIDVEIGAIINLLVIGCLFFMHYHGLAKLNKSIAHSNG